MTVDGDQAPVFGLLATVVFIDDERDLVWVRYGVGNAGFLHRQSGPVVALGSVVLVSADGSSFVEAPEQLFPNDPVVGTPASVVLKENDVVWVRFGNGGFGSLPADGGPPVEIGSVVLVAGNTYVHAPDELAAPKHGIGVVRRIEPTRSLVETELSVAWVPHLGDIDWEEWSTVEIGEGGILRQLDKRPIRYRDEPPPSTVIHSRFRVDPKNVTERFDDIAGLDTQIAELRQVIAMMDGAEALKAQGLRPIRGLLLAGESGTGKTMLARALANEAEAVYFHVRGPEIASKWVNESEEMLRALMDEADALDRAVVFFDEIDSLGGARSDSAHEMSNRLITQFLALLDGFDEKPGRALIVGATNRPGALDPTMLRSGRFDRRIEFDLPTLDAREAILRATKPNNLSGEIDMQRLAQMTDGWCSADLRAMWTRAFQFANGEHRTAILELDCEVAIERLTPQVQLRRTQIVETR